MPRALPLITEVFDRHVEHVGILDKHYLVDVVSFYGYVKFINQLVVAQKDYEAHGDSARFAEDHITLLEKAVARFHRQFDPAFRRYQVEVGRRNGFPPRPSERLGASVIL